MQAVGRIGNYISKSVYTVSAPFHPFGGAVDIIAVQQPDGTYKSNPWYVRFGKFQGVLKTREKVVTICVNGIEADFHMYLNHKGEAYFLAEVDEGDGDPVCSPPSTSDVDADRAVSNRMPLKSISCNYDSGCSENVKNDVFVFGKKPTRDEENELGVRRNESLGRLDLLDSKWTTKHDSLRSKKNNSNKNIDINSVSQFSGVSKDEDNGNPVSLSSYMSETEKRVSTSGENVVAEYSQTNEQVSDEVLITNREPRILEEGQAFVSNLDGVNEPYEAKYCSGFSVINNYIDDMDPQNSLKSVSSESCIKKEGVQSNVSTLPIMGPHGHKLEEVGDNQSPGARTTSEDVKILDKSKEKHADPCIGTPSKPIDSLHLRRRSWPFSFQRSKSIKDSQEESNGVENPNAIEKDLTEEKKDKSFIRTLTPTSKQLASLKLKEGKNIIVFTFQTAMLGKQQVDARIFRWRWDARIVISDVDGTITRSDLLGQVMPLVGMDWSQSGVAHFFSAIKENGYQVLFLSARSIAQSFITRQFLLNIKQDGVALPDGPVVISPDGLFPSLFREVVRRAPHEFKIACLEDIKALFPDDTNPFYAGFGNRDTDEFSYLKVGIPRGKIFIINPKGEIAVNRRVETKSYVSLHSLVDGMFPTMSSSKQRDFSSWNYWKRAPPIHDM